MAVISGIATADTVFEGSPALTLAPTTEQGLDYALILGDLIRQRDAIVDDEGHLMGLENDRTSALQERIDVFQRSIRGEVQQASLDLIGNATDVGMEDERFADIWILERIDITLPTDKKFE